jgi:hypothetical protein
MSTNSKTSSVSTTKTVLPANVHIKTKVPKLYLHPELIMNIFRMHQITPLKKEFCGALIYKITEGGFNDIDNMRIDAYDFFPMDIGSHSYTEANMGEHLMSIYDAFPQTDAYETRNEEGRKAKVGLIHTHHDMATFFSGTDHNELIETAMHHVYYLSLIVNYAGDMEARIALRGKSEVKTSIKALDDGDIVLNELSKEEDVVFYYDCKILILGTNSKFETHAAKTLQVYKDKVVAKPKHATHYNYDFNKSYNKNFDQKKMFNENVAKQNSFTSSVKSTTQSHEDKRNQKKQERLGKILMLEMEEKRSFYDILVENAKVFQSNDEIAIFEGYLEQNLLPFMTENWLSKMEQMHASHFLNALVDYLIDYEFENKNLTKTQCLMANQMIDCLQEELGKILCDLPIIYETEPV